jgi:flagellar motor switch protein FliM
MGEMLDQIKTVKSIHHKFGMKIDQLVYSILRRIV